MSPATILFVGDSITVGSVGVAQGKTDGASFRGPASRLTGWVGVGPYKDPTNLFHGGVGGATTNTFIDGNAKFVADGGDDTHTWVRQYNPDLIHIMLGVNDIISYDESAMVLYERLMGLAGAAISQQRLNNKNGRVLLSTICESLLPKQVVRARALNDLIRKTGEVGSGYAILGIDSARGFNAAIAKQGTTNWTVDGTHPNQAGYNLIASSLATDASPPRKSSTTNSGSRLVAVGGLAAGGWALGRAFRWW